MPKKTVYAYPKSVNRRSNPFNHILYTAVEETGWSVSEYIPSTSFFHPPAILHVHWLESLLKYSPRRSLFHALRFMFLVCWMKGWGTRVVWTLHNLKSHEGRHPKLERRLQDFLARQSDRIISLSQAGLEAGRERFPFAREKFEWIPHPHYRGYYPDAEPNPGPPTFLFLGQVRPYKGVLELVDAFKGLPEDGQLVIAGSTPDPEHARVLTERIGDCERIRFLNRFIPDEEVPLLMRQATAGVLPYRDILNSGSALLFASFDLPIVGPRLGALPELVEALGTGILYSPEDGVEGLRQALKQALTKKPEPLGARVEEHFDPRRIGEAHARLYESLRSCRPGRRASHA